MECKYKAQARNEKELKNIKSRIHRIVGQLNGIEKMLDENRYCGDILIQVSAIESALQSVGYILLQEHLESCVREGAKAEDPEIMKEAMELVKKLK